MANPLVSVVVPVYNVSKYLPACINSLLSQSYSPIEIILVDDGSTDDSGKIADEYSAQSPSIRTFHKRNGGLSDARNYGIKHANGEFLTFADSDDFVSPNYIQHLYDALITNKADLAVTPLHYFTDGTDEKKLLSGKYNNKQDMSGEIIIFNSCDALEDMLYMRHIEPNAFAKICRKELFDGIWYPTGKLYEDIATSTRLIDRSNRIVFTQYADYFYRQRVNSIQSSSFTPRSMDLIDQIGEIQDLVEKRYPSIQPAINCKLQSAYFNLLMKIKPNDMNNKKYAEELWRSIQHNRCRVLKDKNARHDARIASLLSYLGQPTCRFIYQMVRNHSIH
ncbi:glycosyltransferase family 2 protein [Bifidobacterium olomucense]|uniref:Glycosyltransferase group 2 family protein n=1 Tax=Bifidobacterium olomucense TaxID=2675324 RepID=A0A7Y0EZ97_9BIFI|nr:glycosyltransferase [Bifidobacterium sp. DSM 109959]NMM99126.1 glycosyltransferase group 2 family protein [Bifidobacterium sp. DSM 109959]